MNRKSDILVPIFTPFKKDHSVDYDALRKLVRSVLDKGADGLYAGGSSAEFVLLSEEERKKTLEVAVEAADGAFVMAHIGAPGTDLAIDFGKHAVAHGADVLASVPPYYYGYAPDEIHSYYADIADACGKPITVYSLSTLGQMSLKQYQDLLADERIYGLKYTQPNYYVLNRIVHSTDKPVYSGMDEAFCSALAAGATGAIGTSMNFAVEKFLRIRKAFNEGRVADAQAEQTRLNNIIEATFESGVLSSMKYAATLLGVDCGEARRPLRPLNDAQKARIAQVLRDNM